MGDVFYFINGVQRHRGGMACRGVRSGHAADIQVTQSEQAIQPRDLDGHVDNPIEGDGVRTVTHKSVSNNQTAVRKPPPVP